MGPQILLPIFLSNILRAFISHDFSLSQQNHIRRQKFWKDKQHPQILSAQFGLLNEY
jgi:hypothetical protein